ncbi:alpha/beta hydrolase family protein [Niabella aquatica]
MRQLILYAFIAALHTAAFAQKKPLNHTVYDAWQSVEKIKISNNGNWIVYTIKVQEGDDDLVIQSRVNTYKKIIPRGYDANITGDNRHVVFKIKPLYKDIRAAKIRKKKADEMPKDSFAIMELGSNDIQKYPNLISFQMPKEENEWVACLFRNQPQPKPGYRSDKSKDSLRQVIDSLQYIISTITPAGEEKDSIADPGKNNRLLLINTANGDKQSFINVNDYVFNTKGTHLLLEQTLNLKDTAKTARIVLYHLNTKKADTLIRGGNDFKNLTISDNGDQVAFVAERDAKHKAFSRFYKLWYYKQAMDSAIILVDTLTNHFPKGSTVSEFAKISFSKSGERLLFGTSPVRPPKDTSLDIDKVNVDVWNYKDDYLQPYQLENQKKDREKSYLAVYDFNNRKMLQVGSKYLPNVYEGTNADARYFVAVTDTGRRVASQWTGSTLKDVYLFDAANESFIPAIKNLDGDIRPTWISPSGKYVLWYNNQTRHYYSFDGINVKNITAAIKAPLYDEENDVPDNPSPYGIMGWQDGDQHILIYDRYDIWLADPAGKAAPVNLTGNSRKGKTTYRYVQTDADEKYIRSADKSILKTFNHVTKKSGLKVLENNKVNSLLFDREIFNEQPFSYDQVTKARDTAIYVYTKESYTQSPDIYVYQNGKEKKLSAINPQQQKYNWGTASLYYWKTYSGKAATGILYKPENFDSTQKYPVILYFYEKLSDNLYKYIPPAPTASRLNISFFVSRGYVVMTPDISYTIGHPAKSAYDYIVSGAKALTRHSWVDANRMGIQGQSWGGIQVAQLITMTPIFAAAWSGAPVANMTSAYGGIRWSSGMNRQFQYEKTQSRIGATLWEKPELYIENSPLFHLPKVTTPLVIMANDNDGAVPWYQGIELFTGMRRLGKQVWMLNYNGEEHNLVQRKNRKDIQVREQQFFDWLLKGDKPAKWLLEGVPAIDKGNNRGLELAQ